MSQATATIRVNAANIEQALNRMWDSLHNDGQQELGVTRACMSNLIIACQTEAQVINVRERIPALVERHPARVFLMMIDESFKEGISADVSAYCRQENAGQQLCSEYVEIRCSPDLVEGLGSVLRPLLIGDLPSTLWWASNEPPALSGRRFNVLAELAGQVIYDSTGWPDPLKGVKAMTRWVASERRPVFNLVWRHLKPWRRMLAQMLAPDVAHGALDNIHEVRIEHGPHALTMAWLLVGWLAARLEWQPVHGKRRSAAQLDWSFKKAGNTIQVQIIRSDQGAAHIKSLNIKWHGEPKGYARFVMDDDLRLSLEPDSSTLPHATVSGREPPIEIMIAAQLAHRTRDPLFQQTLAVAQRMTSALESAR